jgi:uncharacterized membrane protein YdjX (TVP38/TMEM64 family)
VRELRARRWLAVAGFLLALVAIWQLRGELAVWLQGLAQRIDAMGAWAPLAFVAGYALAVVAFVPASPLTLAGGALFGPLSGTVYVFAAASLGACVAFLIARYAARARLERRIARSPRFAAIDRAIAEQGLRIALLLRLSPVFPFNLLNYALGLTRVRFAHYAVACLGMLPATVAYVYLGSLVGELAGLESAPAAHTSTPWLRGLSLLGVLATLGVSIVIARAARRALAEVTGDADPPAV